MNLLLDSSVWGGARRELVDAGHDVDAVAAWPADPGDEEILATANEKRRILITLDKDFGEMTIVRCLPHAGIIRLVGFAARSQGPVCLRVLEAFANELLEGAIVTVQPGRVRIRPASR